MNDKKVSRLRRARRARAKIRELKVARLCVNRTPRHIYAQVIDGESATVLASASTVEKDLKTGATGNAVSPAGAPAFADTGGREFHFW